MAKAKKPKSQYVELFHDPVVVKSTDGQAAVLVPHSQHDKEKFLSELHLATFDGSPTSQYSRIPSSVVDQLIKVSVPIAEGLQRGQLFALVGSSTVVEGLKNGSLQLMKSGTGHLGAAIQRTTGRIAGQARFRPVSTLAGPAILWSIAHAVLAVSHLRDINRSLHELQEQLDRIEAKLESRELAELFASIEMLEDIRAEWQATGSLGLVSRIGLSSAEYNLRRLHHAFRLDLEAFDARVEAACSRNGIDGYRAAESIVRKNGPRADRTNRLLVATARATLLLHELRVRVQMSENPEDVERRLQELGEHVTRHEMRLDHMDRMSDLVDHAQACARSLSRWHIWHRGWKFWRHRVREQASALDAYRMPDRVNLDQSGPEMIPRIIFFKSDGNIEVMADALAIEEQPLDR